MHHVGWLIGALEGFFVKENYVETPTAAGYVVISSNVRRGRKPCEDFKGGVIRYYAASENDVGSCFSMTTRIGRILVDTLYKRVGFPWQKLFELCEVISELVIVFYRIC